MPADFDEDDFEEDDDEIEEDYDGWEYDVEEDEIPECDEYPDGCAGCMEYECTGPDEEQDEDDLLAVELVVKVYQGARWKKLSEKEISMNPALCRFLNQISATHDL